ncbi:MAG: phosphatidate cytidylyltransferase [Bacilli bacterium]|nr:phosphatidate cytidylyltransferase [Bacilli bacterium]
MSNNLHDDLQVNEISTEQKKSMKSRVITALIMALIGLPCLFFGGWAFFLLAFILLILATSEAVTALNKKIPMVVVIFMYIITLYFSYWIFVKNLTSEFIATPDKQDFYAKVFNTPLFEGLFYVGFNDIYVSSTGIITILVILFISSFASERFTVLDVGYYFMMAVLIGLGFQAIQYLRYYPANAFAKTGMNVGTPFFRFGQSAFLIVYVILGTIFNDIGAYFIGVLFGKHKVNPRISPKKTWEGLIGGVIISVIVSMAFAIIVSLTGHPILPFLTHETWYWLLLISAVIAFLAIIGDFTFSAIKRHTGIKDYSKIFKEHGGVLDRIDSLIFTSIGATVLVVLISQGWQIFS